MDADRPRVPALCPDFLIETYLDHQGEQFCLKYDANSLIYISKAMDLFDMSDHALRDLERRKMVRKRIAQGETEAAVLADLQRTIAAEEEQNGGEEEDLLQADNVSTRSHLA